MDRTGIYYWKCDRMDAFHGTSDYEKDSSSLEASLGVALKERFGESVSDLATASGQGNHRTFTATYGARKVFIRTEDGPEHDDYFAVEAAVTRRVSALGVPVPETLAYDCSRSRGFAWQMLPYIPFGDLNALAKAGRVEWGGIAPEIGRAIAHWQEISAEGYGPFSAETASATGELRTLHRTYEGYYRLNLDRHLGFLVRSGFLGEPAAARIASAIDANSKYLGKRRGVLVHKDLAAWNILGTGTEVKSFIDWDDCIIGDEMDDLSLMGVTADGAVAKMVVEGYRVIRGLPPDAAPRFWLCWLRNMIFKSVIRVGAGYFRKSGDAFFLIGEGGDGTSLEETTRRKIEQGLSALEKGLDLDAI